MFWKGFFPEERPLSNVPVNVLFEGMFYLICIAKM
jgi:hypothetical protein